MTRSETAALMGLPVDELRERARIRFRLLPDIPSVLSDFARSVAAEIRDANARREPLRLILPVGPVAHYRELIDMCNRERISWKNVFVFQMDEFLDWQGRMISANDPLSFRGYLRRELYDKLEADIRIPVDHCFCPDPLRIDEISETMRRLGGIDVCYGGIGYHGHIAFNEPPLSRWYRVSVDEMRGSLTRVVVLGSDSIVVQSINCAGGNAAAIPPMAVTLGMNDILAARKIRLYCAGGQRHRAVFRITVAGDVTTDFPGTLVQGHPDAEVVIDEASAQPIEPRL